MTVNPFAATDPSPIETSFPAAFMSRARAATTCGRVVVNG
jgi:hypothetical protein